MIVQPIDDTGLPKSCDSFQVRNILPRPCLHIKFMKALYHKPLINVILVSHTLQRTEMIGDERLVPNQVDVGNKPIRV